MTENKRDYVGSLPEPVYADESVTVHNGDCLDVLRTMPDASVDAVVTDPPYDLTAGKKGGTGAASVNLDSPYGRARIGTGNGSGGFMGKSWDATGIAFDPATWAEMLRVLKPGGHLLAFGGTRTYHRMACAIEDAGFEIRDTIAWLYGSGFPKSLDVSKAIDKAARGVPQGAADPTSPNHGKYRTTTTEGKRWDGDSGQSYGAGGSRFLADGSTGHAASKVAAIAPDAEPWRGWGTALKPANEPIIVARKSLAGTVAANVLTHGTGALNVEACRVGALGRPLRVSHGEDTPGKTTYGSNGPGGGSEAAGTTDLGRWPTNVVLDPETAAQLDAQTGTLTSGANPTRRGSDKFRDAYGDFAGQEECTPARGADSGGASRFFPTFRYEPKAPTDERPRVGDIAHPTVKPLDLMRWLVRLVTPPGGVVLEPFAGSGTTAEACIVEGFRCIAIEREADYIPLILSRITKPIEPVLFGESA